MTDAPEVVICGGGIAGGALAAGLARRGISVLVLEQLDAYRDRVRGEMLSPWGVGDARQFGVDDCIYAARPSALRSWIQWDEVHHYSEAPTIDLTTTFVPGVTSPLAIHHYATCKAFTDAARDAGAEHVMGIRKLRVTPGRPPSVAFEVDGVERDVRPRLVVAAGGHAQPVARQLGLMRRGPYHHWGGGLAIEGLDGWPDAVQAFGTEGRRNFMVFPQREGRARLYLNFPESDASEFAGPEATRRFHEAFRLACLPPDLSERVLSARPVGNSAVWPSRVTIADRLDVDGVVLIGDEAGSSDTVLGTGLASALRDVRIVGQLLLESSEWSRRDFFAPYREERAHRLRRLHHTANFLAVLSCEFGPAAAARRARAWERMRQNPSYMITLMVTVAGPDRVPEFAYSEYVLERLLAPERAAPPRRRPVSGLFDAGPAGNANVPEIVANA
jgi:2-polyprenyl-6-methoxyphenol hydroxylase-like FAD-dependent oxidoreductase